MTDDDITTIVGWPTEPEMVKFRKVAAAAEAAIASQAAEIAALRADAERIDWLEVSASEPDGLMLHDGSGSGIRGLGLRPGTLVRTLREAIDAAVAAHAAQG